MRINEPIQTTLSRPIISCKRTIGLWFFVIFFGLLYEGKLFAQHDDAYYRKYVNFPSPYPAKPSTPFRVVYRDSILEHEGKYYWLLRIKYTNIDPISHTIWLNRWGFSPASEHDCGMSRVSAYCVDDMNHIIIKNPNYWRQRYTERSCVDQGSIIYQEKNALLKEIMPRDSFIVRVFIGDTSMVQCVKNKEMVIEFFPMLEISKKRRKYGYFTSNHLNIFFPSGEYDADITPKEEGKGKRRKQKPRETSFIIQSKSGLWFEK